MFLFFNIKTVWNIIPKVYRSFQALPFYFTNIIFCRCMTASSRKDLSITPVFIGFFISYAGHRLFTLSAIFLQS